MKKIVIQIVLKTRVFPVLSNLSLLGKYFIYIYFCDVPPKQFNHDEIFLKKESNFCIFGIFQEPQVHSHHWTFGIDIFVHSHTFNI